MQPVARRMEITKALVGDYGVGMPVRYQGKPLLQAGCADQLRFQVEAVQQPTQVVLLHRALQDGNAQVFEVEYGFQLQVLVAVHLRPTDQRRHSVKVEYLCTAVVIGHVRHQVDLAVLRQHQALLPLAGPGLQLPIFLAGDLVQQLAEDAGKFALLVQEDFWLVGVDPHADRTRLCAAIRRDRETHGEEQQGDEMTSKQAHHAWGYFYAKSVA